MQHNEISDAQLFKYVRRVRAYSGVCPLCCAHCCSFDFGGDGGAIPLVGDMADWVAFGTQQGGSQQGAPGSASRSAQRLDRSLRMGRGYAREWAVYPLMHPSLRSSPHIPAALPHEAADEEHFDVPGLAPSGGRSGARRRMLLTTIAPSLAPASALPRQRSRAAAAPATRSSSARAWTAWHANPSPRAHEALTSTRTTTAPSSQRTTTPCAAAGEHGHRCSRAMRVRGWLAALSPLRL